MAEPAEPVEALDDRLLVAGLGGRVGHVSPFSLPVVPRVRPIPFASSGYTARRHRNRAKPITSSVDPHAATPPRLPMPRQVPLFSRPDSAPQPVLRPFPSNLARNATTVRHLGGDR